MDGRRGWWVVFGCFVTLIFTAGVSFFVLPVLMDPIMNDTGWSFTQVSLGVTLWGISAAILSPLCGMIIDRIGARRSILFGIGYTAAGTFLVSQVTHLWQFYAVMFLIPVGPILSTYIPVGAIVPRWFVKRRGVAMGLAMLGIGIGGAIFPLLTAGLLDTHDWRGTYSVLSQILLLAWIPAFLLIRNPNPNGETVDEAVDETIGGSAPPSRDHLTLPHALKTRSFWVLGLGDSLTGAVYAIFNIQLVVLLTRDLGNADTATRVLSVLLLFSGLATLPLGWLADRLSFRRVFVACYFLPAVGALLLLPGEYTWLAFSFAVIAGSAAGGRTALYPIALTNSFGELHIASIWGVSNSLFMIGTAFGPLIGSYLFESAGGTRSVYIFCIATLIISATLVSLIRREQVPKPA